MKGKNGRRAQLHCSSCSANNPFFSFLYWRKDWKIVAEQSKRAKEPINKQNSWNEFNCGGGGAPPINQNNLISFNSFVLLASLVLRRTAHPFINSISLTPSWLIPLNKFNFINSYAAWSAQLFNPLSFRLLSSHSQREERRKRGVEWASGCKTLN